MKNDERHYESISHWGMFPVENRQPEPRKRIEKLLYPVMEQIIDIKV